MKKTCAAARNKIENDLSAGKKSPKRLFAYVNYKQSAQTGIQTLVINGKLVNDKLESTTKHRRTNALEREEAAG